MRTHYKRLHRINRSAGRGAIKKGEWTAAIPRLGGEGVDGAASVERVCGPRVVEVEQVHELSEQRFLHRPVHRRIRAERRRRVHLEQPGVVVPVDEDVEAVQLEAATARTSWAVCRQRQQRQRAQVANALPESLGVDPVAADVILPAGPQRAPSGAFHTKG